MTSYKTIDKRTIVPKTATGEKERLFNPNLLLHPTVPFPGKSWTKNDVNR